MAEESPLWRQLIPYAYITHKDYGVLTYNRKGNHTERALAGKASVGFGGHIEPVDALKQESGSQVWGSLYKVIMNCLNRELAEEALVAFASALYVGHIVDHGPPEEVPLVNRVHAGLVFRVDISQMRDISYIGCGDESKFCKWMSLDEIEEVIDDLGWVGEGLNDDYIWEGWSRHAVKNGFVY
jgi:predicted NUDIX family phosphoesterase